MPPVTRAGIATALALQERLESEFRGYELRYIELTTELLHLNIRMSDARRYLGLTPPHDTFNPEKLSDVESVRFLAGTSVVPRILGLAIPKPKTAKKRKPRPVGPLSAAEAAIQVLLRRPNYEATVQEIQQGIEAEKLPIQSRSTGKQLRQLLHSTLYSNSNRFTKTGPAKWRIQTPSAVVVEPGVSPDSLK